MSETNDFNIHIMAAVAKFEAQRISDRTEETLKAAKARGWCLGVAGAANLKPDIEMRKEGADGFAQKFRGQIEGFTLRCLSQRQMVAELNNLRIRTTEGRSWSLVQL